MRNRPSIRKDNANQTTGSPRQGEPIFIVVGQIGRTHGVKGEIGLNLLTDFPERLTAGKEVFLGEAHIPVKIANSRPKGSTLILRFENYETIEQVSTLRNQFVYVRTDSIPSLPQGEYYHHELLGIQVYNEAKELLGAITEILTTGANDVYVVRNETNEETLLPVIKQVVISIDLEQKIMIVSPPTYLE